MFIILEHPLKTKVIYCMCITSAVSERGDMYSDDHIEGIWKIRPHYVKLIVSKKKNRLVYIVYCYI